jgi:ribosomal protein L10
MFCRILELADNQPNEKIAKYTGLTIEQIEEIRTDLEKE